MPCLHLNLIGNSGTLASGHNGSNFSMVSNLINWGIDALYDRPGSTRNHMNMF